MKLGLIEQIRSVGHWRVVMRPLNPLQDRLTLQKCLSEVETARVLIRGWDFPHTGNREDDQGGTDRDAEFAGRWCAWNNHIEFWRMYRSGQFLSYVALREDMGRSFSVSDPPTLHVTGAIYSVTEFIEFGHRLANGGVYQDGFDVSIALNSVHGRVLEVEPERMPFLVPMITQAKSIVVERRIDAASTKDPTLVSQQILLELFDHFGWNPHPDQISAVQKAFHRREFR